MIVTLFPPDGDVSKSGVEPWMSTEGKVDQVVEERGQEDMEDEESKEEEII